MKTTIKLEELGLLMFFVFAYQHFFPASWGIFFALFFVPDFTFLTYLFSRKLGAIAYNVFHHRGLIALVIISGFIMKNDWLMKTGLIFMAHSSFDRVAGYGLKYLDSFDHTHLGWIGKSKYRNTAEQISAGKV
jgi:Domain of unknown function (DUF4260)